MTQHEATQAKTYRCVRVEHDFWQVIVTDGDQESFFGVFDEHLEGAEMTLEFFGYKKEQPK